MSTSSDDAIARRARRRLGESLAGRYSVLRLLGIGGMAAVYAGVHRSGHAVALKILHERFVADPDVERLFRREALLANAIGHPGVVPVTDDDVTADGCVFLVMPLLAGETLRARGRRQPEGKLPLQEVIVLSHALLGVLSAAHAKKIVHRDVKPENLFLTIAGELKVLDFGIGRFLDAANATTSTQTGRVLGTPAFMAPEQAIGRGREVDARSDIWAVGATMFSLIAGRFVHEAESPTEAAVLAATKPARKLASVCPEVPSAICAVVDRALAFEKGDRWGDADEMDRELLTACRDVFRKDVGEIVVDPPPTIEAAHGEHAPTLVPRWAPEKSGSTDLLAEELVASRKVTAPGARSYGARGRYPFFGRGRAGTLALAAVLVLLAGVLFIRATTHSARSHVSDSPISPQRDLGAAKIPKPDAFAAYRAGVQAWRDGATGLASEEFLRAVAIDPEYADAHLACVRTNLWPDEETRLHFQRANQNRLDLTASERKILEAYEPVTQLPPRFEETTRRLELLSQDDSVQPDSWLLEGLAMAQLKVGQTAAALSTLDRLLHVDPEFFIAYRDRGLALALIGRVDDAATVFRDCVKFSPSATGCLADWAELEANEGHCADARDIAQRSIALDPNLSWAWQRLAGALYETGSPISGVQAALAQQLRAATAAQRETVDASIRARLDVLSGHFSDALSHVAEWKVAEQPETDELGHLDAELFDMRLHLEIGDNSTTDAIASAYLDRRRAWLPDPVDDYSIYPLAFRYLAGGLTRPSFQTARDDWLKRSRTNDHVVAEEPIRWILGFAEPVLTYEDGLAAVAELDKTQIPDPLTRGVEFDLAVGRAFLISKRPREALPYLSRASHSCLAVEEPILHTQAFVYLGQALESNDDPQGACDAYRTVLARWGGARRSVSARQARERYAFLHCSPTRPNQSL